MGKKAALLSLAVLVGTACSSNASPKPTATTSATASVAAGLPLNCRLPVISPTTSGDPVPGGWITFPSGNFERDPASLPIRLQAHVPSYDRAIKAWVPVESRYVSPSGDRYILTNDMSLPDPSAFYLVDVRTNARRLVLRDGPPEAPGSWTVVDYSEFGVYLWSAGIQTVPGLWLLDPNTAKVRLIDRSYYWRLVSGGVAWALDPQSSGPGVKQAIYRLDITTGRVERWYESESALYMISPDSEGHLLVVVGDSTPPRLELLVGPNRFQRLALPPDFPAIVDGYLQYPGVWLALRRGGLALYTARDGLRIMVRAPEIFDVSAGCW